jgi:CubicO group peptidase (beta-lactamase class C family)
LRTLGIALKAPSRTSHRVKRRRSASIDNGFFARGWKGQRVFVFPELELVIATTAHMDDDNSSDLHSAVRKIVSALGEKRSDVPAEGSQALRRELAEPFDGNIPGPVPLPEDRPGKL